MTRPIETALTLLRMAVALLDEADTVDESLAATKVRTAIEEVEELLEMG